MLVCSRRKSCGQCVNLTYYLTREARPGPLQLLIVHVTVRSERLVGARRNPHASPGRRSQRDPRSGGTTR